MCLDGSPGGFYLKPATSIKHGNDWLLHFKGAGAHVSHYAIARRRTPMILCTANGARVWARRATAGRGCLLHAARRDVTPCALHAVMCVVRVAGWCYDEEDCWSRSNMEFGSSTKWENVTGGWNGARARARTPARPPGLARGALSRARAFARART